MEERNTKRKRMVSSPPKIESVTDNTNKSSTKPSTSQSLLEIENVQQNGSAAAIGSSLLKIVDERGNGTKNRRSNNIILNEEIQKEERADKKEESIATKTNRVPPVVSAQPSALLSKLSAFLPQMHEANLQLEEKIQKNPIVAKREIEIDAVLDDEDDDDTETQSFSRKGFLCALVPLWFNAFCFPSPPEQVTQNQPPSSFQRLTMAQNRSAVFSVS